jgi:hypothetical protein
MAVNKNRPHVVLIPEDDKDRQFAVGFRDYFAVAENRFDIRNCAAGVEKVRDYLVNEGIGYLQRHAEGLLILLIDFDNKLEIRRARFDEAIPAELKDRVFVIGSIDKPERLTKAIGISAEKLGKKLAEECDLGKYELWQHEHLSHNEPEVRRLQQLVKHFLFVKDS